MLISLISITLDNSFIVPYKNAGQEELLYAMYLVVDKVSRNHASVLLTDLQKIVEQIASERSGLSKIATITSTPNGEKLVKRNKFSLINELHFPHGWKYWERSIFNDQ